MRNYLLLLLLMPLWAVCQTNNENDKLTDPNINAKFYHIDVEVNLDTNYLKGNVWMEFVATKEDLSKIKLNLHSSYKVDSVAGAKSFSQSDNFLIVNLGKKLKKEERHFITVFYEGYAPIVEEDGIQKGLIWSTHGKKNNPVIASVCFPNGGPLWFPCKRGGYDKVDSVYVDVTIENRKVEEVFYNPNADKEVSADIPIIAVSNGNMEGIENVEGGKRKFKWRHRHRIAPHHVLVAISNYMKLENNFKGKGHTYPIDFYIFPEQFRESNAMYNRAPEIMACLTNTFGPYPFKDERFAVTMVGIPLGLDGMPTQSNVLLEEMKSTQMYKLVHQAASMWFGNHISPENWQDAWITEALAAYAEAMWQEYKRGLTVYQIILDEKEYFEGGPLYLNNREDYSQERFNNKGMYVMHMLRGIMGDAYFFESLQSITARKRIRGQYSRTYISTERFREICEYYASENIDQDYGYFFDQWVFGEYFPDYMVKYQIAKGKMTVSVKQKLHETSPEFYKMPVKIEIIDDKGNARKEILDIKRPDESFTFDVASDVTEMRFDPSNWVFKDLKYTCKVTNSKFGLENFDIVTSNHRRKVDVSFNIPKKQDITIQLVQVADGVMLLEDKTLSTQEFSKQSGDFSKTFKIPLSLKERGVFKLVVTTKGEEYTKLLRLKRIKEMF